MERSNKHPFPGLQTQYEWHLPWLHFFKSLKNHGRTCLEVSHNMTNLASNTADEDKGRAQKVSTYGQLSTWTNSIVQLGTAYINHFVWLDCIF